MSLRLLPLLVASASGLIACSPEAVASEQIIWTDETHTEALFLPAESFAAFDLDELPLPAHSLTSLATRVDFARNPPRVNPLNPSKKPQDLCKARAEKSDWTVADDAKSITEAVRSRQFSFVGVVGRSTLGWSTWTNSVVTAMWVRVESVLHTSADQVIEGQTLSFIGSRGGSFEVAEVEICDPLQPGDRYVPQTGDRVLIAGNGGTGEASFIPYALIFPIRAEQILPQPYPKVQERRPTSLESLQQSLTNASGSQER